MTRVAIVAAPGAVRGSLDAAVRTTESLTVSAAAASIEALASSPGLASTDVVLLHASAGIGGRELDALPPIPVVAVVGDSTRPGEAQALLAAGARGVIPANASAEEIAAAVEAAAAGLVVVPPELVSELVAPRPASAAVRSEFAAATAGDALSAARVPSLTPREREVLAMLAEGLPNKLIASRLGISEHTVKTHVEALFEKLGASTRAEAVARGVRRGLLLL